MDELIPKEKEELLELMRHGDLDVHERDLKLQVYEERNNMEVVDQALVLMTKEYIQENPLDCTIIGCIST